MAASKQSLACRSRYCEKVFVSDAVTLESLVETTVRAVADRQFDVVIPVSYAMTLALAQRRECFAPYTHLEIADANVIARAANKLEMLELAAHVGVPRPKTFSAVEVQNHHDGLTFPVVIKPQKEWPGRRPVQYARNLEEMTNALSAAIVGEQGCAAEDLIVQEFVPGIGCGFFATYQQGICKRIFMHRRVREYPASGGVSSCAESFYDSKLESHGRKMLDALGWHGVAMVEFKRDSRDGEYKLLEVNPKFWGSLDLALAAGADFPGDICRMALGKSLSFSDHYNRNIRYHWPFSGYGELFHIWTRPASVFQVAMDFLNPSVRSNIWITDLEPNVEELRQIIHRLPRLRGS